MSQIKSESYTEKKKGYLKYPYNPTTASLLLKEKPEKRYMVEWGDTRISEHRVTKPLWEAIKTQGGNVYTVKIIGTTGRKNVFGIPVEIRKVLKGRVTEEILIRVTGNTIEEVITTLVQIKEKMSPWEKKPTMCVWTKEGYITPTEEHKPKEDSELEKDVRRLENLTKTLQLEIAEIKEKPIKKAMVEDRNAMKGVLS